MSIADWLPGGRKRRGLALSIDGVADAARSSAESDGLDDRQTALWTTLCEASRQTLAQLFVKSDDKRMDWGLKRRSGRVDDPALVTMYWWTLLYQIVVFSNRGAPGEDAGIAEADRELMHETARRFLEIEFSKLRPGAEPPGPWSDDWRAHFPLESAMALYNSVYALLGMRNDPAKRIAHVSHFTTLTERSRDRLSSDIFS